MLAAYCLLLSVLVVAAGRWSLDTLLLITLVTGTGIRIQNFAFRGGE